MLAVSIRICVLGLFLSEACEAVPELPFVRDLSGLSGAPRGSVVVLFNAGSQDLPSFKMARPDIVPIDGDGHIIWYVDDLWRQAAFAPLDRIVLEKSMFGKAVRGRFSFPGCYPKNGEMITSGHGVAWIVTCGDAIVKSINNKSMRLAYNGATGEISSVFYNYKFNPHNEMLFKSITLKGSTDSVLATDSDLYIKADIKNFFTLNFRSADIESKMISKRFEPTVALASIGFYLKVLFFKIVLDLTTDVSFFESSANIPMVMTLPVDASKRLNKKSGVLYSFKLGEGLDRKLIRVGMPLLNPSLFAGQYRDEGLKYCSETCNYALQLPSRDKNPQMEIVLQKNVVELGMFPWFVSDVGAVSEQMGWKLSKDLDLKNRVAVYFEVSGLPAGSHPWDFWMSF